MESQLVTFLVIVGVPVLLSFLITRWSGQKIVTWLPASYMLVALWVLSFGMLNKLHLGVILIAPALLLVICVTIFVKRESLRIDSIKELTSIPMILFVSLAAWTFLHSQQMKFYLWDEFSGWGPFVKSMFLFDALGPYSPAKIGATSY
jgi:hypothetical protein